MKYLPIVAVLLLNMPVSAAFAACGGSGNFPGGDNCGLVGGGYQGAPGPIIGGVPALLGIGGIGFGGSCARTERGHRPQVSRFGLRPLGMKLERPFCLDG